MSDTEKSDPTVVPNIVHIMDLGAFIENLRDELPEMAHFSVTFNKGEPTVAFSLPNSSSEDFNSKFAEAAKLTYALLEQAGKRREYKSAACDDGEKHDK